MELHLPLLIYFWHLLFLYNGTQQVRYIAMSHTTINRSDFIYAASSLITSITSYKLIANPLPAEATSLSPTSNAALNNDSLQTRQKEIDIVTPKDFAEYLKSGNTKKFAAFDRLEKACENVLKEISEVKVTDLNKPAIWYLYNMGIIVKTPSQLFAVDLHHRRAPEFAKLLDFMMITHSHGDHWRNNLYTAMDAKGKTVISNFLKNPGAKNLCGYVPEKKKTLTLGDITIVAGRCDHNAKLIDFTTPYEIHIGSYTIYHTGECGRMDKIGVTRQPDLWVVHPYCGLNAVKASQKKIKPKKVVVGHLQELGHAKNRWRWTYNHGLKIKDGLERAGFQATMPLWGERIA